MHDVISITCVHPKTCFYDTHMYGEKMTAANVFTHGFQNQDFAWTLNQALGRSETACPADVCETHPDYFRDPYFSRTGTNDDQTDEFYSDALEIDRELVHLMQNNMAYRSTTERLLQKMVLFTHAIDQGGN